MKSGHKPLLLASLVMMAVALASCGGTPTGQNWGGSGSSGSTTSGSSTTYTISGTVNGLSGGGLVLLDNGTDTLSITGTGIVNFTFGTAVSGAYNVTVKTQPTNPVQTCSVTGGSGTATANVSNVQITCTTSNTVGGTITGLLGSGLVLKDNGGDNLTVTGSGTVTFTFTDSLALGATYDVTVATQPSNPNQTCNVANGSGTITNGSVTSVQISCSQPKYSVGGAISGLVEKSGDAANCTNCPDTIELQDNAGDNLFVTGDVPFTFPTQFTYGTTYFVNEFLFPSLNRSQPESCSIWNATALVTADVSNVQVDCQHDDWAWMFPSSSPSLNAYGDASLSTLTAGSTVSSPPFSGESNSSSPGGRDFPMSWIDNHGYRWLFGGYGFEVSHTGSDGMPGFLNDMWVWPTTPSSGTDDGWWSPGGWIPADLPILTTNNGTTVTYSADIDPLQTKNGSAVYPSAVGSGTACGVSSGTCTVPGSRWGGVTWTDSSGNLWLFGGEDANEMLMNDIWEFDAGNPACDYDQTYGSGTFTNCEWIWQGGSQVGDQPTTNTAVGATNGFPGGRWGAAFYTDTNHNLWMFGGQGVDSGSNIGLLNDLWECTSPCTTWKLVAGTTLANQDGIFPTATGGTGTPGGRQNGVLWVDSSGNVWLFGGWGLDSVGTTATGLGPQNTQIGAILNDLWEYSASAQQWIWVSGSNTADQNGVYGIQGTSNLTLNASATNMPGSRWGAVGWVDPDSSAGTNLFLFGGFGLGSQSSQPTGFLNDVWEYQSSSGQWIWWKGSTDVNQPGTYITSPQNFFQFNYVNNEIGARRGAAMWLDTNPLHPDYGQLYIFGGQGYVSSGGSYGDLNDLWRYTPFCSHDAPCLY